MPTIPEPKPIVDRAIAELLASGDVLLESQRNQPSGFAGLDSSGNLLGTVTHRRGTAAEINAIVLADGELAFVTDLAEVRRGDGATPGGLLAGGGAGAVYAYGTSTANLISSTEVQLLLGPYSAGSRFRFSGAFFGFDPASVGNVQFAIRTSATLQSPPGYANTTIPAHWIRWTIADANGPTITTLQDGMYFPNAGAFHNIAINAQIVPTSTTSDVLKCIFNGEFQASSAGNIRLMARQKTTNAVNACTAGCLLTVQRMN